ncbi:MAG TPA: tetratricopeptide repeat protein [Blastocatellia bacterium]|nr:tetratricopeptide repeat protein [Blastocatellia bacterium]HMV84535.1 tetratricopeptide repeat protein [Blastocatellia bacterium]HMX27770.1 tetratricopeptide repeat protein [Blastocatellia bacterium]HMY73743.1 tetratricopeptide repeat protein [Blastocatellia bacterium]HMZ17325.1 tetratricopeptide repeat protein [Blastocatellia bacterium]
MNVMNRLLSCGLVLILTASLTVSIRAQVNKPKTDKPEVVSLLGVKHFANADEKGEIAAAEQKLAADPKNIDLLIALGRAQANVWRYHDAIETYTRGIRLAPNDARLYRHRGHRYISTRQFDKAVTDMARAAKLNDKDFDIWYHLALAHYLKGQFDKAAAAYERCRQVAEADTTDKRDDSVIAVSDWLYMTYRRMNKPAEAAKVLERITPEMKVKENKSYFDRLLFYKGLKKEEELVNIEKATDLEIATVGYGLGNWHLYNSNRTKAEEFFRRIVAGKYWPAFGFIAAEAELARTKSK